MADFIVVHSLRECVFVAASEGRHGRVHSRSECTTRKIRRALVKSDLVRDDRRQHAVEPAHLFGDPIG